jgi:Fur family peroxide stress response transcriptional regulator
MVQSPVIEEDKSQRLVDLCRERGIPLTHQRRVIFDAIVDRKDHPTADQIFDVVHELLPQISRMTVYRVLDLFVDLGVISKVCHPGVAIRFDPTTAAHHHLICVRCSSLFDLENSESYSVSLPDTGKLGFEVRDFAIQFRGVCKECLRKKPDSGNRRPRNRA